MKQLKKLGLPILSVLMPMMALAQSPLPNSNINTFDDVIRLMCKLTSYAFTILVVLAIVFVIVAAFRYLTASGDPEKVKKANHTLIYAAVSLLVAILAKAIPFVVGNLIGAGDIGSRALGC